MLLGKKTEYEVYQYGSVTKPATRLSIKKKILLLEAISKDIVEIAS